MMKSILNPKNVIVEITEITTQLQKLKLFSIRDKTSAAEIAECIAQIHLHDLSQNKSPVRDARWVIGLIREHESCEYKDEIISALEYMSKFERYNPMGGNEVTYNTFMAWNIESLRWQGDYRSGHIGSYAWDIAAVINQANDPEFNDAFLESYMRHSGREPTLALLQSNLYYVQVAEAARSNDFEMAVRTAREITGRHMFKMEMISGETISRLGISGF